MVQDNNDTVYWQVMEIDDEIRQIIFAVVEKYDYDVDDAFNALDNLIDSDEDDDEYAELDTLEARVNRFIINGYLRNMIVRAEKLGASVEAVDYLKDAQAKVRDLVKKYTAQQS